MGYRYAGGATLALDAVSLELSPGEVLGVVGGSEAGKSTLCLVAAGLAPGSIGGELIGRVRVEGQTAIVFQDPGDQLSRTAPTVWEEVAFGPRNQAVPLGELIERTAGSLDTVGIAELASRDPARLSGGQAQLVAIAGALAMRPQYLLLDEPTAQLDPQGTLLLAGAIDRLAGSGVALLITEQKTDLLQRVCHRIIVLDAGRFVMGGPAADVLADPRLPGFGVAEPSDVRMRRLVSEAGLDPDVLRAVA